MERAEWYVELQGLTSGPYPMPSLIEWASTRQLQASDRIYSYSQQKWILAKEIDALSDHFPPPLRLENFVDTDPVTYMPPSTKKAVPWREKKKKFWEVRKTEERVRATIAAYVEKQRLGEIKKARKAEPERIAAAEENKRILPSRPEHMDTRPKDANPKYSDDADNEVYSLVEGVKNFAEKTQHTNRKNAPAIAPKSLPLEAARAALDEANLNLDTELYEDYSESESNFHKILFFGFLGLSLVFAAFSYWLDKKTPMAADSLLGTKSTMADGLRKKAEPEKIIVASPDIVIRDGELKAPESSRGSPSPSPTNPSAPTSTASAGESIPGLKPPIRPNRE